MNSTQHHGLVKNRTMWSLALVFALTAFAGRAAELPACLPPIVGQTTVAAVRDNGVLVLKDRRIVKLEGLLWPAGERDGATRSLATRSAAVLRELVVGRHIALRARSPMQDRYGRLRVEAVLQDGLWLQSELLRRGLARVSIAPDRRECARELYAAEAAARQARAGLWAISTYAMRTPESLRWRDLGTFQIVEGTVVSAKVSGGRAYLDFGRNWRTDFTVTISPEDMKTFRRANADPYSYAGKTVRVRGYIDRLHGFEIEAAAPEQIEIGE